MVTPALEISHLKKTYANGVVALQDIDLTVTEGDFFALLGPNGAGKSTTIGVMTSLVTKTAGTVQIFGFDIDRSFVKAKQCLGVVPQEFNFSIFETVLEILLNQAGYYGLSRRIALQRAEYYLKKLELWEKRNTVSRALSGGMKRRLMIARALIHEPRMLILDEPTAGVDIEIRRSMWQFLISLNRQEGVTIILTTHYLEEAENLCHNLAIIDHGLIIQHSSMASILTQLDQETFILYLAEPYQTLPQLDGYILVPQDAMTLAVEAPKKLGLSPLFAGLQEAGIVINSMRNKTNRLEELFIRLTADRS